MRPEMHLIDAASIIGSQMAAQLVNSAQSGITLQPFRLQSDGYTRYWTACVGRLHPDQISSELFEQMLKHARTAAIPLTVSHLPDGLFQPMSDGFVAGLTDLIWTQNGVVMLQGHFENSHLGRAAYESIANDNDPYRPVRVSVSYQQSTGRLLHLTLTRYPSWKQTFVIAWKTYQT